MIFLHLDYIPDSDDERRIFHPSDGSMQTREAKRAQETASGGAPVFIANTPDFRAFGWWL
jgi:hypothetical protein